MVDFMKRAIELSKNSILSEDSKDCLPDGGPFGAVIVKDGKIIGEGHNSVLKTNHCCNHGEVMAIKNAEDNLGTWDLSDCDLYTSCEPCPMCLMTSKWANIANTYYAADRVDAENVGFKDNDLYSLLKDDVKTGTHLKDYQKMAVEVMREWAEKNKVSY